MASDAHIARSTADGPAVVARPWADVYRSYRSWRFS
jgi:hypothetical protein